MFLVRCFKLEKEYEEYLKKDQGNLNCQPKDRSITKSTDPVSVIVTKPRSDTIDEVEEHISDLPKCVLPPGGPPYSRSNSLGAAPSGGQHPALGRSISAGIYEDDVLLVNYQKFQRDEMPYVFDDRKTREDCPHIISTC